MVWNWDNELKKHVATITEPVDTVLLGRKMADGFTSHWAAVAADPDNPDHWAGKKFTDTPKIVFTKTLDRSEWPNTELAKGDLADEIDRLKNLEGEDIIVYGGANFVTSLIKSGLMGEYHLFIDPTALGKGLTIFNGLEEKQDLILVNSRSYDCGIVAHCFEPKRTGQSQAA